MFDFFLHEKDKKTKEETVKALIAAKVEKLAEEVSELLEGLETSPEGVKIVIEIDKKDKTTGKS